MGTSPTSAPQTLHYTLFFDAQNAVANSAGLFSFSAVRLGTEAFTTFDDVPGGPFAWPAADLLSAPVGSKIFFSFVENSGNIIVVGRMRPPVGSTGRSRFR